MASLTLDVSGLSPERRSRCSDRHRVARIRRRRRERETSRGLTRAEALSQALESTVR
jgi:hypothetical protein